MHTAERVLKFWDPENFDKKCGVATGEAQKIDRIMEKFAERYCRDNPHTFASADGAYLLAFALIMLNTDVHNPMADAQLAKPDFVGMCQTQVQVRCQPPLGTFLPAFYRFSRTDRVSEGIARLVELCGVGLGAAVT